MSLQRLKDRDVVLIVDDTPANLNLLTIALDEAGLVGLVALDGYMALEQLKLIKPDLILLDLIMPGMDGFELCRHLQADEATRDIPVIIMTAMDDTDHVVQGFSDGAVDYVVKPIRPHEVVARIQAHLRRSRSARQTRAALASMEQPALAVDAQGRIVWSTETADRLMTRFHAPDEADSADGKVLPADVRAWVLNTLSSRAEPPPSMIKTQGDDRLEITVKPYPDMPGALLLLKAESRAWPTDMLRDTMGLTGREAEILMWVAYGKTNRQIGEILGISPRTVNKHLDHVFMKLGVESRAAAAAIAIRSGFANKSATGGAGSSASN